MSRAFAEEITHKGTERLSWMERVHQSFVCGRRVRVLARHLAAVLPPCASVLDVGCGDGILAGVVSGYRPDLHLRGLEVLPRPASRIAVEMFDGTNISQADRSVDAVMLVDVLHHAHNPLALLGEAARVARLAVVIKDHVLTGVWAGPTLRWMDRVSNRRYGVALPYNYWPRQAWYDAFQALGLTLSHWQDRLHLYPWPASLVFDRSLHFLANLSVAVSDGSHGGKKTDGQEMTPQA